MNLQLPAIVTKLMPINAHEDVAAFCIWSLGPDSPLNDVEKEIFAAATADDLREVAAHVSLEITRDEILNDIDDRILEIWASYDRSMQLGQVLEAATPEHRAELGDLLGRRQMLEVTL